MKVIINSREKEVNSKVVSYSDVVAMAFPDTDLSKYSMSVTYTRSTKPPFKEAGILSLSDDAIEVTDGMRFNATLTWNG